MQFTLPTARSTFAVSLEDGAVTRVRQHGDPAHAVRLVLSHGSGFAIDGYLPFWQPLLDQFEVVLFDHRNHGWNPPSDPTRHHYAQLVRDVDTIVQGVTYRLGPKPTVGVFHSMAARAAMKHAVDMRWCWDALVLFDPPNIPPVGHPLLQLEQPHACRRAMLAFLAEYGIGPPST